MTDQIIILGATSAPSSFTGAMRDFGFEPGNLICAGESNDILYSRRCSVINGKNVEIISSYNNHAIGGISENKFDQSNRFDVYCSAGIYSFGDVVAYQRSDIRLKENILFIKNATNVISQIKPISFDWNNNQERYQGKDIGFSAQNIEKLIPCAVQDRKDGYKAVKYTKIIPLLVQGIKEKQLRINNLKQQIERIKNGKS